MINIRRNDTVQVLAGKDRGKRGKVRRVLPDEDRVVVDGINMVKKHARAPRGTRQAGIIDIENPLQISNVVLVCAKCNKPTRVAAHFLQDGKKVRKCRRCGEVIE
jgi:large subunit ribosomal protein L24